MGALNVEEVVVVGCTFEGNKMVVNRVNAPARGAGLGVFIDGDDLPLNTAVESCEFAVRTASLLSR